MLYISDSLWPCIEVQHHETITGTASVIIQLQRRIIEFAHIASSFLRPRIKGMNQ